MKLFNDKTFYNKNYRGIELFLHILLPVFIYFITTIVVTIAVPIVVIVLYKSKISFQNLVGDYGLLITLISQIITLLIILLIYKKDKKTYPKIEKELDLKTLLYGSLFVMAIGIISGYLMDFINYLFPSFGSGYSEIEKMLTNSYFISVFASVCVLAPIMEEIMFRGIILNNLLSKRSVWYSIIISSFIFGLIHMNLLQGTNAFILGIALSIVFIKTRNIYACMFGHFLNNLIAIISTYTNFSGIVYDIINIVLILICIYPILIFIKTDNVKIEKNNLLE